MPDASKLQSDKGLRIAPPSVSHPMPTDTCQNDPDLTAVIKAWSELPEAIKAGIIAMVRASGTIKQATPS
jgi:hypothetical protein